MGYTCAQGSFRGLTFVQVISHWLLAGKHIPRPLWIFVIQTKRVSFRPSCGPVPACTQRILPTREGSRSTENKTLIRNFVALFNPGLIESKWMNVSATEEYSLGTSPDGLFNLAPKAHPRWVDNCLVYVYQFLTSNFNFETTSNFPNFYFHQFN